MNDKLTRDELKKALATFAEASKPTWGIGNELMLPWRAKCMCGHTLASHGSRGYICCACACKKFEEDLAAKDKEGERNK